MHMQFHTMEQIPIILIINANTIGGRTENFKSLGETDFIWELRSMTHNRHKKKIGFYEAAAYGSYTLAPFDQANMPRKECLLK